MSDPSPDDDEVADPPAPAARKPRFLRFGTARGWRAFGIELVVVVLGVLIALFAQQWLEQVNIRNDLADLRAALDREVANNLAQVRARVAQSACLDRRLDQLETWQRDWRDGEGPAIEGTIGRPLAFGTTGNVWNLGASGIANRLPLDQRLAYARLYGQFDNYMALRLIEIDIWRGLWAFDGATRLSPEEVNRLRGAILSARSLNDSMRINFSQLMARARQEFGILPAPDPRPGPEVTGLCGQLRFVR